MSQVKFRIASLLGGLALLLGASAAQAVSVSYNGGAVTLTTACATSNNNDQGQVELSVESATCANAQATQVYKADVADPVTESGGFAGSYSTVFSNTSLDPEDATISYTGGTAISCAGGCFLAVKDGNATPALYVFNISSWNGTSSIMMTDFWAGTGQAGRGAISNVSIWTTGGGGGGNNGNVPEPGSIALAGLALFAAAAARRRKQSKA